jgi:hypothetical protein
MADASFKLDRQDLVQILLEDAFVLRMYYPEDIISIRIEDAERLVTHVAETVRRVLAATALASAPDPAPEAAPKPEEPIFHLRSYGDVTEKELMRLTTPVSSVPAHMQLMDIDTLIYAREALDFYGRYLLRRRSDLQGEPLMALTPIEHDCGDRARAAVLKLDEVITGG